MSELGTCVLDQTLAHAKGKETKEHKLKFFFKINNTSQGRYSTKSYQGKHSLNRYVTQKDREDTA